MAIMKCLYCDNEFDKPRGSKKKYCSKRCCTYASMKRTLTPEKRKINNDLYKKRHPNYQKEWRKKNRIYYNTSRLKQEKKYREECEKLIGDKCIICESSDVDFHEIHGKKHICSPCWIRHHSEDFIPLCGKHHKTLHGLIEAEKSGVLKKILELLKTEHGRV